MKAFLALEDGTIFEGHSFGAEGEVIGQVVFNTGMTGYQEVLTDPSYYGQIVTMTYPLIGNYGINPEDMESAFPQVKGLIVRELCRNPNNWRSVETLNDYLQRFHIIGIEGIDTRQLTRIIREKGPIRGIISTEKEFSIEVHLGAIQSYSIDKPVDHVTTKEIIHYPGSGYRIALIDYGLKQNIVRSLLKRGCEVFVFPANATAADILDIVPQGIVLSNGPGDPKDCQESIETIRQLMQIGIPILGICLGHQLIALAAGGDTAPLKYGHRGCNHPVKDVEKDRTYITSQNHGYAVVETSLGADCARISHRSMNDGTVEGVVYLKCPVVTVQFHPEAAPGPNDTGYLFDEFLQRLSMVEGESGNAKAK
jgi:carbamoyl-phosphate synthase small subunit